MAITDPIAARVRTAKRTAEVVTVLARHGFASFVERTGIVSLIEGGLEALGRARTTEATEPRSIAVSLRRVVEDLGATYIKLGQILSVRPDLVPPEIATEFRKLQSDAPKVAFDQIRTRLEEAFPDGVDHVFRSIDEEPLAAASLAQTHRAVLRDGTACVIKILRPHVEEQVAGDIAVLRELASFVEKHFEEVGFSPTQVVEEFARQIERELDYIHEGRSTDKLRKLFAEDENVQFPIVHWEASTPKVLTMEEIRGVQLSRAGADDLTAEVRRTVCEHCTRAVFRMCLEFGFFHADPHPGNMFVLPGGSVCFIDCGMTGHVDTRTRQQLGQLVRNVLAADLERTVRVVIDLANADPTLESDRSFRSDVWEMITRFETRSIAELDVGALLNQFFEILRRRSIHCPSDLVYLIKALATVEGVAQEIDPAFNVVGEVEPLVRKLFAEQYGFAAMRDRVSRTVESYVEILEEFPHELRQLLVQFRRRDFSVRLVHDGIDDLRDAVFSTGRFVAMALVISALFVGSAILILSETGAGQTTFFGIVGRVVLGASLLFVLVLAAAVLRRRFK